MIAPSDEDYVETKFIKLGKRALSPTLRELADWIAETYSGAVVLNIHYDKVRSGPDLVRARLNVIFEREHELKKFCNAHENCGPEIVSKSKEILADRRTEYFDTQNLFVIFSAFEPVARVEAIWSVTDQQNSALITSLADATIWTVRANWDGIVVFSYTNAELKMWESANFKEKCSDAYAALLGPYDQFGYLRDRPAEVTFDSKENFESKYKGNWFNYDRR